MIRHALALLAHSSRSRPRPRRGRCGPTTPRPPWRDSGPRWRSRATRSWWPSPTTSAHREAVYVYGKRDEGWTEVGRLTAENAARGDLFGVPSRRSRTESSWDRLFAEGARGGVRVREGRRRLEADRAARGSGGRSCGQPGVGGRDRRGSRARRRYRGGQRPRRRARLPRRPLGFWSELARIAAPEGSIPDDRFGDVLALQGSSAIVAAARADGGRGAVFLYGGDGWTQLARIAPDSLTANARFGSAIEIGEDVVLVGAPGFNGFRGAVHVYRPAAERLDLGRRGPVPGDAAGTVRQLDRDRGRGGVDRRSRRRPVSWRDLQPRAGPSGGLGVAPVKLT